MDLTPFEDLPKKLSFQPGKNHLISRSQLIKSFGAIPSIPDDLLLERGEVFNHDGLEITSLSWWVGYGPKTKAFLVRPEGTNKPLPGIVYLHSHDDVKSFGIEKVFDYGIEVTEDVARIRELHYESRPPVNELAKKGFAVLVFDAFLWGSRKFPLESMPLRLKEILQRNTFEDLAVMHESMVLSKYLSLMGTTLAGLLNFEDQIAVTVAKNLPEFSEKIATVGLSGGGCRALYLQATNPELRAVVSVGAMATYESMLEKHVAPHSWMFFPFDLASKMDWPQVAMINSTPLYLQFCANDQLFTLEGMKKADQALSEFYQRNEKEYKSDFYPVTHSFTTQMQDDAFGWLEELLLRD